MTLSFSLFGLPLQEEFESYIQTQHVSLTDIEETYTNNPGLVITDNVVQQWATKTMLELRSYTSLEFKSNYHKIEEAITQCPTIGHLFSDALQHMMQQAIHEQIDHIKKPNISRDLDIITQIITIHDNSPKSQEFLRERPDTWKKISSREAIDYNVLVATLPYINNPNIRQQCEEYLMVRLCKQNELKKIELWKNINFNTFSAENKNYCIKKLELFLRKEMYDIEDEDLILSLFDIFHTLNIESHYYQNIITHAFDHNKTFILEWFATHFYEEYKNIFLNFNRMEFQRNGTMPQSITMYPHTSPSMYTIDDILEAFPIPDFPLPPWFKELSCYDAHIETLSNIYSHNIDHYSELKVEYVILFILVNMRNCSSTAKHGLPPIVSRFLNKNEHLFSDLKEHIQQKKYLESSSIEIYILEFLLGGKENLINHFNILDSIGYDKKSLEFLKEWPINIMLHAPFGNVIFKMLLPDSIVSSAFDIEDVYPGVTQHRRHLAHFDALKKFIYEKAYSPEELELMI